MDESCKTCRFWRRRTDRSPEFRGGYCLRLPPIFMVDNDNALNAGWPTVGMESWCGEYRPKTDSIGATA